LNANKILDLFGFGRKLPERQVAGLAEGYAANYQGRPEELNRAQPVIEKYCRKY
jgi:hypothetical protein